jgi:site-specific DNA recombinase
MSPDETKLLEIECGVFSNAYLVYNRKSTDDAENQRNSIRYQRATNLAYAVRERLPIAPVTVEGFCADGIISEHHSGFKESFDIDFDGAAGVSYRIKRPKFYKMAELLSRKCFKGVIFLSWDRVSRNKADDVILQKLIRAGVDIRFALAQYDTTAAGALHMDIDGAFAAHHSRVTSEKVRLTIAQSRRSGLVTYRAPVGYLNPGRMEHKPLDPERAPTVRRLFELAATGHWTLAALTRWANDQGFTMQPFRKPRSRKEMLEVDDDAVVERPAIARPATLSNVHRILTNPFYSGKTRGEGGEWTESRSHEALVDEDLFWHVQAVLSDRRVSMHYSKKRILPFRGFVRCQCGRLYTPYQHGAAVYYSARCSPQCLNDTLSLKFAELSDLIRLELARLALSPEQASALDTLKAQVTTLTSDQVKRQIENERRLRRVREDQAYLQENRVMLLRTGAFTAEGLVEQEAKLAAALRVSQSEAADVPVEDATAAIAELLKLSDLIRDTERTFDLSSPMQKEDIAKTVFVEISYFKNVAQFKARSEFQIFFDDFTALHDPNARIVEMLKNRSAVNEAIRRLSS